MTDAEARHLIFAALKEIAPEADPGRVAGHEDLREALDLDSMDFMNFVVALHERTGLDIPETNYPKLRTIDGASAYLQRLMLAAGACL